MTAQYIWQPIASIAPGVHGSTTAIRADFGDTMPLASGRTGTLAEV